MLIQRLQWAGALIESEKGDVRILIDPVYQSPDLTLFGEPKETLLPLDDLGDVQLILVTHLHSDHFDPNYIIGTYGPNIPVLVPHGVEDAVKVKGLTQVIGMGIGDSYKIADVTIFSSYAIDGFGDLQVSWIVKDKDKTIIHSGDTLWHGYWWKMAETYGPFSAALLPINGAVVSEPGVIPSHQPICLTPEQAVAATRVLGADLLIPIHYGVFHNEPIYLETGDLENRLSLAADQNNVTVKALKHNETLLI